MQTLAAEASTLLKKGRPNTRACLTTATCRRERGARVLCRQGWRHPCGPWACPNFLRQCQVSLVGGEVRSFDFFEVDCISSFATSSSPSGTKLAATSSFSGRGSEMCRSVIRTRARPRRRGLVLVKLARAQAESAGCESGTRSSARRLALCPRYGS